MLIVWLNTLNYLVLELKLVLIYLMKRLVLCQQLIGKATKGESWYVGDTYHFAIGQGDVLVNPLQVANFTAAVANGGKLLEPHLVSALLDSNNNVVHDIKPKIIRGIH